MKTTNLWTVVVTLVAVLGMAHVVQGIDLKLVANVGNLASNTTYNPCQSGVSGCVPDSPDALGDVAVDTRHFAVARGGEQAGHAPAHHDRVLESRHGLPPAGRGRRVPATVPPSQAR